MTLIQCNDLTLAYDGQTVLSDLSFSVKKGDYFCIVGENGSGKSTLMKALLGILKPVCGSISFEGLSRAEIGYLPQRADIQRDLSASVREVVLSGTLNQSRSLFYTKNQKSRALESLRTLHIDDLADECYRDLSGGQQQRVLLARALCATSQLIVLDEPITGLDPLAAEDFYQAIHSLNKEQGITIVMVSHDIPSAIRYADCILHLDHSRRFFGTTEEYTASDLGKRFMGGVNA